MAAGTPSIFTKHGSTLQIWTAEYGKSAKTSGTVSNVIAIWCHVPGSISVTFTGNAIPETWTHLADGDQIGLMPKASVTITSGTWSFMVG